MKGLSILILLLCLLSGCWNRKELNDLAIVVGMGVDISNDQYVVTTQVVNPGQVAAKQAGGQKAPVILYQQKGDTLFEAIRRTTTVSPRKLYFPHLRILVIGEELAKKGLKDTLDWLSRDHDVRTDFYIVVAKDSKAENVLKVMTALENIPANKLFSSLEASEKAWAPSMTVTLDELIPELASEGKQSHLTGLKIIGNPHEGETIENVQEIEPAVQLQYSNIAVFKEDKLIGWLNEGESKGLNYILGNVKSTIGEMACPEGKGKIGVEVLRTKSDLKAKIENGSPKGTINIQIEGNIGDVQCKKLDLSKTKTIYQIEKKAENEVNKLLRTTLSTVQDDFEVDIFGFGEAIQRSNPDFWDKNKKDWDKKFTDMPIDLKITVKIRRVGTIGNSPIEKIK
ncbi:spore gernimation protein GerC [Bacillus sp. SA1-12]|nr:spore gernimation protein GerC [Bacillus sp. SA1-12]